MKATLTVHGMSCQHCVKRVKVALEHFAVDGVVDVDLDTKQAVFSVKETLDTQQVSTTLDEVGYDLVNIDYQD